MAGISLRGKTWHLRMRVPRRYQAVVERREIHRSLGTDSRRRAETLLPAVEADIMAELEARLALREGRSEQEAYQSAVALSRSRGFRYRSLEELQTASTGELVERVEALAVNDGPEMAKALLGGAPAPSLKVNRPGFPRGFFVQKLGGIFKGMCLFVECVLHFLRRPMPDGTV